MRRALNPSTSAPAMKPIDTSTQLCAVIGHPVGHSLSPAIHNAAFAAAGLNYAYLAFDVDDVAGFLTGMRAMPSFRGVSVTIPHKRAVMAHLDEIDPMARDIGSINTITQTDGRLTGTSTDGPGTLRAFAEAGVSFEGKRVLFTGNGGAVRAVAFAVATQTPAAGLVVLGRDLGRVRTLTGELVHKTGADVEAGLVDHDMPRALAACDIVIQGTPIGMHPHPGESCIPRKLLRPDHVVFDMVYRPHTTRLIEDAQAAGCTVIHGVEMLINQAVLQFETWTGAPAPYAAMRRAVLDALGAA